ncbi:hypothetical protein ES707_09189 [subsurface metagenome]
MPTTTEVFQRGETVPIWAETKNAIGEHFNPTPAGIKVTLRDPERVLAKDYDGTDIDNKTMAQTSTGKYVFYYNSEAVTTLASTITAIATSITVATGEGALLPASDFFIEIDKEILKCSSRTDDVLTVTRGQKSTKAADHSSGVSVWRLRGWWHYYCKAVDGTEDAAKTVITHGSFKLN